MTQILVVAAARWVAPEDRFCRLCGAAARDTQRAEKSPETPYRYLFEHAAEALAIVDAGNTITRVNHKFAQLSGLQPRRDRGAAPYQRVLVQPGP